MTAAIIAAAVLRIGLGSNLAFGHEASIRTEGRVQQAFPGNGTEILNQALELQPGLALTGAGRLASVSLAYNPRYTHLDGDGGKRDNWLHLGSLTAAWQPSAAVKLRAEGHLTRGTADLFRNPAVKEPGAEAPPLVQAAPLLASIDFQRYQLRVGAEGCLSARLLLRAGLDTTRESGVGAAALRQLPLQQVERLTTDLDWRLTRTDTLGGAMGVTVAHYYDMPLPATATGGGAGVDSWIIWSGRLAGTWRHGLSRDASTHLSAGVAVVGGGGPARGGAEFLPTADLGIILEPRLRNVQLQGGASLGLAPLEDRLSGTMVERADLRAWIGWIPAERLAVRGAVSGGQVVSGQSRRDQFGTADVRLGWAAADFLDFALGLRGSVQAQPRLGTPRFVEWSAYLAVSAAHRRLAERIQAAPGPAEAITPP